MNRISPDSLLR